jgi:hypothetical protein
MSTGRVIDSSAAYHLKLLTESAAWLQQLQMGGADSIKFHVVFSFISDIPKQVKLDFG